MGFMSIVYGMVIFVILPTALIAENFGLMLTMFFIILVGMIFGLALLISNFQPLLDRLMIVLLFFWEKKQMRQLVEKNLICHRVNNKQTSLIYSLTVGTVIFLFVALSMQFNLLYVAQYNYGKIDIALTIDEGATSQNIYLTPNMIDPILMNYTDVIADFGYSTLPGQNLSFVSRPPITFSRTLMSMQGFTPSNLLAETMRYKELNTTCELNSLAQLYQAKGSQGFGYHDTTGIKTWKVVNILENPNQVVVF